MTILPNRVSRRALVAASLVAAFGGFAAPVPAQQPVADVPGGAFRPPSVPLVTHDPYFSVWSNSDTLNGDDTRHWTGKAHPLTALVRVDGKPFRLMGKNPASVPALKQTSVIVTPTRTVYSFAHPKAVVTLTFLTPALPADVDVLARPITYVTFGARALDKATHTVAAYFDAGGELAVTSDDQAVKGEAVGVPGMTALRVGSVEQPVLAKRGDDLRIDWGHLYLAGAQSKGAVAPRQIAQTGWAQNGALPLVKLAATPRAANGKGDAPVLALSLDMGRVSSKGASRTLLIGYDDEYSLTYMKRRLRPYWRRNGATMESLLPVALQDYPRLVKACARFDAELMAQAAKRGGPQYADIVALAHRQALAANKIVADANGAPLMFSKENFSNGCIGTVDLLYPAGPQLLLLSPTLAKASLRPILNYSVSPRWKFPFAPHDLGTYPRADGQVYGGGERTEDNQMPVEETGNMLILLAAVARCDGNTDFSDPFWPLLKRWAAYLEEKGFDPENQLCTDDFAGHLAHNVNLSAKAIEALGAYALLCEMRGGAEGKAEAARIRGVAKGMAAKWIQEARDGDHFRLAFDRPGTWSQKYNLAWDRILSLNLFPDSVLQTEMAYYQRNINRYGLPLDNREPYTKLDWTVWTATLTNNRADFNALIAPTHTFLSETTDRVPMTDWHQTREPRKVGFQARSVVGGVFLPLLTDASVWEAWSARDLTRKTAFKWAALPVPPVVTTVVPSSQESRQAWRYTFETPRAANWYAPGFRDGTWLTGDGGFGTPGTPGAQVRTEWRGREIWARRMVALPASVNVADIQLYIHHDEDADVYINGVLAARLNGYSSDYETVPITPEARAALKPGGENLLAVYCRQTRGGQYIDVGLSTVGK